MDIRAIALDIYQKTLNDAQPVQAFELESDELSKQDIAFIKRLIMTSLRKQETIKKIINRYASKKLSSKLSISQMVTIMGAAEILYFRTPDYATVNSYVNLAKTLENKFCGGFVNAILHKICNNKEELKNLPEHNFFPSSFIKLLSSDYSKKQIADMEKTSLQETPLDITVKQNPEIWAEKLGGKLMGNGSVRLNDAGAIPDLEGFDTGEWWIQDLASSLAVQALGDIKDKTVLDLCAAPGGKTAQLINNGAKVSALDISETRLQRLQKNLSRLNFTANEIINEDALSYLQKDIPDFDIILIDAPCSATGTLRRHPEVVHNRDFHDVNKSTEIQQKFLQRAADKLKTDGILLYSVCSLAKLEGEKAIETFLQDNPNFKQIPITIQEINHYNQIELNDLITSEGYIRCIPSQLPQDGGLDGFFVAKLQKGK